MTSPDEGHIDATYRMYLLGYAIESEVIAPLPIDLMAEELIYLLAYSLGMSDYHGKATIKSRYEVAGKVESLMGKR